MGLKIVCISDTHNKHDRITIPECDILIHAGDATGMGTFTEVRKFAEWFEKQPAKHKIFVPGNHELDFANQYPISAFWFHDHCPSGHLLINAEIEIEGIRFYGSPITPFFLNWAWNEFSEGLMRTWKQIPDDVDILITHGPPYGILDRSYVARGRMLGCTYLRDEIKDRVKPDVHIFGHIHDSHGTHSDGTTDYYNVSICTEEYNPDNPITIIDYTP